MNRRGWRLRWDIKIMGFALWSYLLAALLLTLLMLCCPQWMKLEIAGDHLVKSNLYLCYDFILPLMGSMCYLLLFGTLYEPQTFAFLRSLPLRNVTVLPGLRLMLVLMAPYVASLWLVHFQANRLLVEKGFLETGISFARYLMLSLPNLVFFCGLGLLLIVCFHKVFYAVILIGGYALLDIASMGNLFGKFSLFINLYGSFRVQALEKNRILFFTAGIACFLIACILGRTKRRYAKN